MAVFFIPFLTFISSDEHTGFSIPFFKIEYTFLMTSDWCLPNKQVCSCVSNLTAINLPQSHVSSAASPFSTSGSNPESSFLLFPIKYQLLTDNFSYVNSCFGVLHPRFKSLVFLPYLLPVIIFYMRVTDHVSPC